ncbi:MAG: hypothetical protein U0V54_02465 [Saprospiraceae bacterium]
MKGVVKISLLMMLMSSRVPGQLPTSIQHYFRPSIQLQDSSNTHIRLFKSNMQNKTAHGLPFFCGLEERCYKQSGIPFKFRLGSLPYADYLENKSKPAFQFP